MKLASDDDTAWNLVEAKPRTTMTPSPPGVPGSTNFMPTETTVVHADGSTRLLDPDEAVLIAPVTRRLGTVKDELRETGGGLGWELTSPQEWHDVFTRAGGQIDVFYHGEKAVEAGRSRGGETIGFPFEGISARNAAITWFKSAPGSW